MQVTKALESNSLKHFTTMKRELENIKPQQYPGQHVSNMSLDVTYHCQSLTTAGILDHQLCLSILSAFLLTNVTEMYHHSLITMKATPKDKLKKDSWSMPLEPPTFTTKDLPMSAFVTSLYLGTKKSRVWVCGLLPHMPRTPRHHILPSPKPKSVPLSNAFRRSVHFQAT